MPFVKGQSGNPAGRPVGSRNRFTREMDEALELRGLPLIDAIANHAHTANPAAMRLCLDRLAPMGKHKPSGVELPPVETPDYTIAALTEIQRALGEREIATEEAIRLVDLVGRTARVLASKAAAELDFADRLARCEEALALNGGKGAGAPESTVVPAAPPAPAAPAQAAIDNNNAETMTPAPAEAVAPAAAPSGARVIENNNGNTIAAAILDEAVRATVPRRPISVREQLMSSTSHLALTVDVDPRKFTRVTTQPMPLASAA